MEILTKRYENVILMLKQRLPKIIENYKLEKSENSKKELRIIENYYKQILMVERMWKKFIGMLENNTCTKNIKP